MPEDIFDVVVVGAGPAGGSAGLHCSRNGLKTLIIEEHEKIGEPVHCGECLSLYAVQNTGISPPEEVISEHVKGVRVIFPDGTSCALNEPGFVLEKEKFEQWLCAEAVKAGAKMSLGTRLDEMKRENGVWEIKTSKGSLRSKIIIDASGVASVTSRKLNLNERFEAVIGIQYELRDIPREGYLDFYIWPKYSPHGYCVTENTEIIAKNTVKPISSIALGEEVLTLDGWRPVEGIFKRRYDDKIISITPSMINKSAELTQDHGVFVWNKKNGFEWKTANKITKGIRGKHRNGDYLVFPLPKEPLKNEIIVSESVHGIEEKGKLHPIGKNQHGATFSVKNGIKNRLKLTKELMEFFGYYVSEGSTNSSGIIIANDNEKFIKRAKKIGEKAFGIKGSVWTDRTKKHMQLNFGSIILKKLFAKMFAEGVHNKKLPHFFHGLKDGQKISFFRGLVLGDGCKETVKKDGKTRTVISFTTVSKSLIYDTWIMLAKTKIIGAIKYNSKHKFWQMRIAGTQLKKLEKAFGKCFYGKRKTGHRFILDKDKILLGIRKLEEKAYSGMVYDIQTNGSFCPCFAVHNCWMIPKKDGRANVGIATTEKNKAKAYTDMFVEKMGWKGKPNVKTFGGLIPASGPMKNTCAEGLMLIGDAAGFTSPLFEGGSHLGLKSGEFAARVAKKAVEKNDFSKEMLLEYEGLWKAEFPPYAKIVKGKDALYSFTDDELNFIARNFPRDFDNFGHLAKAIFGLKTLVMRPKLFAKGFIPAMKAFEYSQARHYGW